MAMDPEHIKILMDATMDKQSESRQIVYVPVYPGVGSVNPDEDEIDLFALWYVLWKKKFYIIAFTLMVTLGAAYVSFYILPVTYQSQVVLMETGTGGGSKLGGLEGLASGLPGLASLSGGIGSSGDQLMAFLQSGKLKLTLIEKYALLPRIYKDIWDPVKKTWKLSNSKHKPTPIVAFQQRKLDDIYLVDQDDKTRLITISWVDEDPAFAADVLKGVVAELQNHLVHDYVSDAKRDREFAEKQLTGITKELERWEQQTPNENLPLTKIQREVMAASAVYTEMRKQVELAKLTEAKELVSFKVVDPPFVPEAMYKPQRLLICAVAGLTAVLLAIAFVLVRHGVAKRKVIRDVVRAV